MFHYHLLSFPLFISFLTLSLFLLTSFCAYHLTISFPVFSFSSSHFLLDIRDLSFFSSFGLFFWDFGLGCIIGLWFYFTSDFGFGNFREHGLILITDFEFIYCFDLDFRFWTFLSVSDMMLDTDLILPILIFRSDIAIVIWSIICLIYLKAVFRQLISRPAKICNPLSVSPAISPN